MNGALSDNTDSKKYIDDVLFYLEHKYNEKFSVLKAKRVFSVSDGDVILALCHSEKYPLEPFDVVYHLSGDDIYQKDEMLDTLRKANVFLNDNIIEYKNATEAYFEDNYINVIMQHRLFESYPIFDDVKIIVRLKTPNCYPNCDYDNSLSEYFDNDNFSVVCTNYVFIQCGSNNDESEILNSIKNKKIPTQYIRLIYTSRDLDECEKLYYQNYEYPYEVFENDDKTDLILSKSFSLGT